MTQSSPEAVSKEPKHGGHAPPPGSSHDDAHEHHGDHAHAHGDGPHLAHHFDTYQQQFDAGKLGIWLFLLTEVLFFAGLFCAYTVYRAMHPEVFVYAHYFLDTNMGALNTCVLLVSSLTAAWAVRNAQLAQKKLLVTNIVITIACAATFMVVKYVEYSHKFHDGLLWGSSFNPTHQVWEVDSFKSKHPESAVFAEELAKKAAAAKAGTAGAAAAAAAPAPAAPGAAGAAPAPAAPQKKVDPKVIEPLVKAGIVGPVAVDQTTPSRPRNAHAFFSIYFFMTGLHGLHVLIGIGVWIWLLLRAMKGQFGPKYFGPIDYAALYWHLVDLIWIYLFPLLYLIH